MGSRAPEVHIHYLRPPDRTDVFVQELVHDDGRTKVTFAREIDLPDPLRIGDRVALEDGSDVVWFTFPGAWHDIGRFHLRDGTLTGIYANILIPCTFAPGEDWETTDLFLDLWMPADAGGWAAGRPREPVVLDAEELDEAERFGWVTRWVAARARAEADRLVEAARSGRWPPPVVEAWTRERIRGGDSEGDGESGRESGP